MLKTVEVPHKIPGARRVTSKVHNEEQQTLSATVQNSVARATCRPGFVHLSVRLSWK